MLYTFSKNTYDHCELAEILSQVQPNDAILLWQDGVLQAVKNPKLFASHHNVFLLENDVIARAVRTSLPTISLTELVKLTESYSPQLAL